MTFANLSPLLTALGLAALAGILYAIQHLRTRHREITVPTIQFWKRAVEDAPVRKFWESFKHPWAYLLILAICSLMWLGLAEPKREQKASSDFYVFVLDGSAGMAAGERFKDAVKSLQNQVGSIAPNQRQVLWSAGTTTTLLNPGEHELLLEKRLKAVSPEASPAGVEKLLRALAVSSRADQQTEVAIFGDAPVRKEVLDGMPKNIKVVRATALQAMSNNAGITALGVADAQSGAWNQVDVFVQVQANQDTAIKAEDLQITLDNTAVPPTSLRAVSQNEKDGFLVQNVPAEGGLFAVKLATADAVSLDNSASIRLPNKPFVKVQLSDSVNPALRAVLKADPAVQITADHPNLVIRREGETVGASLPALEFVSSAKQKPAFLLTYPKALDAQSVFIDAVNSIGLRQIDAMELADVAQKPIEVSMSAGQQWKFSLWQELLSDEYNFTQSRSFPLFVANAVRWLAGVHTGYAYVAVGQPLPNDAFNVGDQLLGNKGQVLNPLGTPFVPQQAGEIKLSSSAKPITASLLSPESTLGTSDASLAVAKPGTFSAVTQTGLATALMLLALILLGVEWYLYQKGRMP